MDEHAGKNTINHRHHRHLQVSAPLHFRHLSKRFQHLKPCSLTEASCLRKPRSYMSRPQGQDVRWVSSALPPRLAPGGLLSQDFAGSISTEYLFTLEDMGFHNHLSLAKCLSALHLLPCGHCSEITRVTEQHVKSAAEWRWHYILDNYMHLVCHLGWFQFQL